MYAVLLNCWSNLLTFHEKYKKCSLPSQESTQLYLRNTNTSVLFIRSFTQHTFQTNGPTRPHGAEHKLGYCLWKDKQTKTWVLSALYISHWYVYCSTDILQILPCAVQSCVMVSLRKTSQEIVYNIYCHARPVVCKWLPCLVGRLQDDASIEIHKFLYHLNELCLNYWFFREWNEITLRIRLFAKFFREQKIWTF